jgi:hypothetical protein
MEKSKLKSERKIIGLFLLAGALAVFLLSVMPFAVAQPTGAGISAISNETAPIDTAGSHFAYAGNVSGLTISGFSTTQTWQGYYGNVSGVIQLADADDNVLYNWTLASPEGEVYASTNQSFIWTNIQCLNFTANGSFGNEGGNGGTTNLGGLNLSTIESRFNIASDDVDGLNETFTLTGAGTHDLFFTANRQFSEGECISTRVFNDNGIGINNEFEEVLLYEPVSSSIVFASILEESTVLGFDSGSHDFEMLVLEDGHGTDVATTTYYFFVELE